MKVDETIESVGRVWQQITVLVILHLVFLGWAIVAGVTSGRTVAGAIRGLGDTDFWSSLKTFHTSLEAIGLELPLVASIICVPDYVPAIKLGAGADTALHVDILTSSFMEIEQTFP